MLNQCIFEGRLTKDPELKKSISGIPMCQIIIAVDRSIRKEGRGSLFLPVTLYGAQAENVAKYFHKGRVIIVGGRLEIETFKGHDGIDKTIVSLQADRFEFPAADNAKPSQSAFEKAALEGGQSERKRGNLEGFDLGDEETPF